MKSFGKNVVVAGLAGALSLGMIGCTTSSTTTTTIETSTTDEDGTTTTTSTTTTTTDGDSSSSEGTVDLAYANGYYGIGFEVPDGFTKSTAESDGKSYEVEYYATDGDESEIYILLNRGVTNIEGVKDEASWAEVYGTLEADKLKEEGETDIEVKTASGTIGNDTKVTSVLINSKKDGEPMYRVILLSLDDEGDGLSILLKSDSEETLELLEGGLCSFNENA